MEDGEDRTPVGNIYGDVCMRKARRKRQKILIIELFLDYAKNSTLHGLRYIADQGFTIIEKLFWFLTFTSSSAICCFLIYNVYIKWKTSPVIVSFSEHIEPVGNVPFPSVTICPQIKSMSSIYNYTEYSHNITREMYSNNMTMYNESEIQRFNDISLICNSDRLSIRAKGNGNASTVENIRNVSPKNGDVFYLCFWKHEKFNCSQMFYEVLTKEGVCFNFNSMAASEIFNLNSIHNNFSYLHTETKSKGYNINKGYMGYDSQAYPRRGSENGPYPDLEVILQEKITDRSGLCNSLNKGFKIYIQNPSDMPQSSLYYYAALSKQVSSLALKFNMITTADGLKDYPPEVRQCYFPEDRPLRYFRIYTPNNCKLECQSNYTYEFCKCVAFHMPHYDSRKICGPEDMNCVDEAQGKLSIEEIRAEQNMYAPNACRCFPECKSVYYDAEILKTEFDLKTYIDGLLSLYNLSGQWDDNVHYSKVDLYFKEPRFISMRRSELFGLTDFMANIGGLLGLFLGFSFLSLVEIFYFITIRMCCILRRDLKDEKETRRKSIMDASHNKQV